MSTAPLVTIFVRHSADCKYARDEFYKRCNCRKHLRWTHDGKQHRRKAGTRSWAEAEQVKREIEDQYTGTSAPAKPEEQRHAVAECVDLFIQDKKSQGVSKDVLGKYRRELDRFADYCGVNGVYVVQGITRELMTRFCATWEDLYPSSLTRAKVRERVRSFLRYCYEAQWLPRIPQLPKVTIEEPETQPLTADEYARLLDAVYGAIEASDNTQAKTHAFLQCMRWTGLSMLDTIKLERGDLRFDEAKGLYRVVTHGRR